MCVRSAVCLQAVTPSFLSRLRVRDWVSPDLTLMVAFGMLLALGLVMIQSSTVTQYKNAFLSAYFVKQLGIALAGLALAATVYHKVSMDAWCRKSPWLLLAGIVLLVLVHVPGIGVATEKGVNRWINLGLFTFQPVEVVKLFLILYLAAYCSRSGRRMDRLESLLPVVAVYAAIALLLLAQPDYGSVVLLLALVSVIVFVAGANLWHFAAALAVAAPLGVALLLSSSYRMERVISFLNPWGDPYGAGYHQTHSLMAFGRGGWDGTGLGLSVEKWGHLMEAHNDFIVSIIAEELGFIGLATLIVLYAACVVRCAMGAEEAAMRGDAFSRYALLGIVTLLGLQVFINVGSNIALLPVKGLTLPFVSYGGSSLVACMLMAAIALRALREQSHPPEEPPASRFLPPESLPWGK